MDIKAVLGPGLGLEGPGLGPGLGLEAWVLVNIPDNNNIINIQICVAPQFCKASQQLEENQPQTNELSIIEIQILSYSHYRTNAGILILQQTILTDNVRQMNVKHA